MFDKVLIANRGEIACRIARTLRRMRVRSVAVYSEADRHSRHVFDCDEAVLVGPPQALQSYLNAPAILSAAQRTGAQAVHPGYGFLSENSDFARAVETAGLSFIGPTPEQIRSFGLKHTARELAQKAGLPLLPGSELLESPEHARAEAERVGYPVMLKSSAGGGGIGMQLCEDAESLARAFEVVTRLSRNNFGNESVFLERFVRRARHLEVQLFGDGRGRVVSLGERECSLQRRNQKVIEETPAPNLPRAVCRSLNDAALALGKLVSYRSAGTVEFVYDEGRGEFFFLEVNTRLQVEHGVTEAVTAVDLVEWMVRAAAGAPPNLASEQQERTGHAIEVRVYAEDPARDFKPSSGLLTEVVFPENVRVDTWVESGSELSPFYDPMLAKIIALGQDREQALARLCTAIDSTRIAGVETNLDYLRFLVSQDAFVSGKVTTQYLSSLAYTNASIEIEKPGTHTLVVDYPGRIGFWDVGIPPSGPMDALAMRFANRIVGNPDGAAALELTVSGPRVRFGVATVVALTGARMRATLDGAPVPHFQPVSVAAGQVLELAAIEGPGIRTYLALRGGIDVPAYLGSKTTFTLGGFGGHGGRALRRADVLHIGRVSLTDEPRCLPQELVPVHRHDWRIGVLHGPHGAPDFFTARDIETLLEADWEVHYNSARTGVRLVGPKPEWARSDGGEAGLHPSNIHDVAYAIGAIDFTGDMPILLGPDGPSLGGFVCPATVVHAELWKMGQLRPGDRVRFVPLSLETAEALEREQERAIRDFECETVPSSRALPSAGLIRDTPETVDRVRVMYRRAGDKSLLVEYGPPVLDLKLRFRVHALMCWMKSAKLAGVIDLTPGIRSLQIHYDNTRLSLDRLLDALTTAERELPPLDDVEVPARVVHLPLSWDDPATRLAIEKYVQSVRSDAPWAPSNIEFIRRINGLDSIKDVYDIVFGARYLVLGLGDVYLGAPVATPVDPRHRLVTTKYNPARTWTPENAVGIGGAYLCIYGMEGPGGYQFVGRTLQVYNRFKTTREFAQGEPWLLRFFDEIRFYPVSAGELLEMREAFPHGRLDLRIEETKFRLRDQQRFLANNQESIANFKARQQAAFEAERQRWIENGQLGFSADAPALASPSEVASLPAGHEPVECHVAGSIWKHAVLPGARVRRGDTLLVVESMKMEISIEAPADGVVTELSLGVGSAVLPGQRLAVLVRS